jgi:uncharacterized protein YbcC (UPF0753/DUF2309 family)
MFTAHHRMSSHSPSSCAEALSIEDILEEIAHYLPSQGPIKTFVHHNTLHHFEHQDFFEALNSASQIYSANRALPETVYQNYFAEGRIKYSDLNRVLTEIGYSGESWISDISRRRIARSLLFSAPVALTPETLQWRLVEKRHLDRFHEDVPAAKIRAIRDRDANESAEQRNRWIAEYEAAVNDGTHQWLHDLVNTTRLKEISGTSWSNADSLKLLWIAAFLYAMDVLRINPHHAAPGPRDPEQTDIEAFVNPYLIKFTSAFLDVGLAHIAPVERTKGLLVAFFSHLNNTSVARPAWLRGDTGRFADLSATQIIETILAERGIPRSEVRNYLLSKALILKGWAGLVYQSQCGVPGIRNRATVAEFLAVRLILEALAEQYLEEFPHILGKTNAEVSFELNRPGVAEELDSESRLRNTAYHLLRAFQLFPLSGSELLGLPAEQRAELINILANLDTPLRLKVWHKAYEWNLYYRAATALLRSNVATSRDNRTENVLCQVVCCIDDREESFRRYLEEISPDYETFGTAGFFGVDAEFHSLYERPAAFCPVNVVPTHRIELRPKEGSEHRLIGLQKMQTLQSDFDMFVDNKSRSLFRGWLIALGGILALFPLLTSILAPGLTHRLGVFLRKFLPNPSDESAFVFAADDDPLGHGRFTVDEMVHRVRTLLLSTGLAHKLAPLVVVMGHGSFSTNNPFRSAYDCGACGGRPGRMNPRVFAMMANRKDVRAKLREAGLNIPDTTSFIGAFHNTCTDEVEYFDIQQLTDANAKIFERLQVDVETARARNALERCRRFDDTHVSNVKQALAHVESRAHHIAQPRPEYGHATNAMCIVGRRQMTKGLFLDRRAFLVSYDPTLDSDCTILQNLLRAVIPVCMGINLEYFFSALDNQKYGAGTKLPHNVTSLLGIMAGYCSDLRTGLPAQMVEIHEPVRLLVVLEQEPEKIVELLAREPELARVINNRWLVLMAYASERNQLCYYNESCQFTLFDEEAVHIDTVPSSLSHVVGQKGHLEFVRVGQDQASL